MRRYRPGLTLVEILLTLTLFSFMLTGAFRLATAHREAITLARSNNLALYVLTSLQNRLVADFAVHPEYDAVRIENLVKEIWLPAGTVLEIVPPAKIAAGERLTLRLNAPAPGNTIRNYERSVVLP